MTGDAVENRQERWAVLTDWDGTATNVDSQVALLDAFGRPDWRQAEREVSARGLGSRAYYLVEYDGFRVPADEVARFVRANVRFDPSFPTLAQYCLERQIPLQVVSDGQRFLINLFLGDAGLDWVPVAANDFTFTASGVVFRFAEPQRGCGLCGNCKREWMEDFHRRGFKVVYAGDGASDRCPARLADAVFARGYLLDFCRAEGIACQPFNDFTQVEAFLRGEG